MLDQSTPKSTSSHFIAVESPASQSSSRQFHLSGKRISQMLISFISFFAVCHLIAAYLTHVKKINTPFVSAFAKLFNLNSESSFSTFFSSLILLVSAVLLYFIYRVIHRNVSQNIKRPWLVLSLVFLFLCLDENFSIHEQLIPLTTRLLGTTLNGFLYYGGWVVPYLLILFGAAIYFWRFVFDLPAITRKFFFISGLLYVGGAIGVELMEGFAVEHQQHIFNQFYILLQETMEMTGITLFIHTLLSYIRLYVKEITAHL